MCGIAGFTHFQSDVGDLSTLEKMGNAIFHRGPDAGDSFFAQGIALTHRRLSIIDLSEAGIQPMHYGDLVIVFNGEIYNYPQLKQQLLELGHAFKSNTDTEILLALYQEYGTDMLAKINGMFAFALWDKKQQTLFIARDRLGKKPLYYTLHQGELCFASELKALLKINNLKKDVRDEAIYDFMAYQYVPDPKTIFNDIYKLEPGHYLLFDGKQLQNKQYWDISFKGTTAIDEQQSQRLLKESLQRATAQRLMSDVPLGAFLSGGIDSSAVVSLMQSQQVEPVTTCSIGFKQKQFNETEFAVQVATHCQTNHVCYQASNRIADDLQNIAHFFDEPFADPSLLPTYYVANLARQKVTVALAGDGGDEMLAGYEKYRIDAIEGKIRDKIPASLRRPVFTPLASLFSKLPGKISKKAATLCHSIQNDPADAFYQSNAQITDQQWQVLANDRLKEALGSYHPKTLTRQAYYSSDAPDHLGKILYTDIKTYLPGDILVKVDRMSMANSLEVRAPMLDYQFAELCASLPSELKLRNMEKKYILKQTFKDDLPPGILNRKKMGFSPPLSDWLKDDLFELAKAKLLDSKNGICSYFNQQAIHHFWQQHQSNKADHSSLLWSLLMFQLWWDDYMEEQ